ncbi:MULTISPECIES: sodium/glutamate symporter [Comamonas]|uniref:Sodium/glutamate symporter n=1 Tax=Comamonas avium TaxID=2762231 RepID=A0ABR8SFW2_9BURK|nr:MULTISPECIES: sodium/glutamate symporter [Comamonas]MBD7962224.1 sodium/glutamate symporter [Comamonas avium]MBD9401156.1 sodium/glutamate symporter [Comamonas sp. CMM02]
MHITFSAYYTLIMAVLVLLLGKLLVSRVRFLREFNIPEPVAGGLVVAAGILTMNQIAGWTFAFDSSLQTAFMLVFFSSIGLSANFAKLREGGLGLVVFLLVISGFIVVQNGVGMGLAAALGLDPLIGVVAGSITLVGGHGTAGAWGTVLEQQYGLTGATTLGIACATCGLVIGSIMGGPLAKRLVSRYKLAKPRSLSEQTRSDLPPVAENLDAFAFEAPSKAPRLITSDAAIETMALFAGCLAFGELMSNLTKDSSFQLPTFVWCLGAGVLIRNILDYIFGFKVFDRAIDVFGNAALSIYLAIALLSMRLWELADLAGPLMIIMLAQTVTMALFAYWITFRAMGKDYDAALLAAGQVGFGMGSTPTAIANMQAITNQYGPSHKAFLIVPLVGAFFIDIVNAFLIQASINLVR